MPKFSQFWHKQNLGNLVNFQGLLSKKLFPLSDQVLKKIGMAQFTHLLL